MKKLFFASIVMLATLTACTNDSREEITSIQKTETSSKLFAREADTPMWDKPSDNPYDLDGYLHVVLESENTVTVVFMGEKMNPDSTEAGKEVLSLMDSATTSRRTALIYCKAQFDGFTVSLVQVSGNNQPRTYWMVVHYPGGHQEAIQTNADMGACGRLHFQAMFDYY